MRRGPQSTQSVPRAHKLNSEPGPPSSHSLSERAPHVLRHVIEPLSLLPGPLGGGGGGNGDEDPQSKQSVPASHIENSLPGPPSSQSPSEANQQLSSHMDGGEGGVGGRLPPEQSVQSVPGSQIEYSEPEPPSSQSPSWAKLQVSLQDEAS